MASKQFLALLSTTALVAGAMLVGDAFHGSIVDGSFGIASTAFALRIVSGLACIWFGYVLRDNHEEFLRSYVAGRDAAAGSGDDEFDERLSPLGEEGTENLRARERREDE